MYNQHWWLHSIPTTFYTVTIACLTECLFWPRSPKSYSKKWNESGFRPPLCTYRLNRARRTSWGWWDDWDDTVLQTQDSKFEPWRSEAEHATSRSRRLPKTLTFTRGWGRNYFCFYQTAETGNRAPNSGVKGSGANHYPIGPPVPYKKNTSRHAKTNSSAFFAGLLAFFSRIYIM